MENVVTHDSENEINIKDNHEKGTSEILFAENLSIKRLRVDGASTKKNQEYDELCVVVRQGGYGFCKVTKLKHSCKFNFYKCK